jgi:hypothetical protein
MELLKVAGGLAGCIVKTAAYPMERIYNIVTDK